MAIRFEAFADEVLAPAIHPRREALGVEVFQTAERMAHDAARVADYDTVRPGFRWGPVWSTAWFRIRGEVPAAMAGRPVALRFSSGTEALLWWDGAPRQGFDDNRDACLLFPAAKGGEAIDCLVEAACNMPLGISTFWWDHPELRTRWAEERPGRLGACELVVVDEELWRFRADLDMARRLALALPEEAPRAHELVTGLRRIVNSLSPRDVRAHLAAARAALDALLEGTGTRATTTCTAVGHAHIDNAWLWPIAETRRKVMRSWANVLELMDRYPKLHFLASQAQQYAYLAEDAPALYERLCARVEEGRWEAGGAMWVECDANVPSGESLVRQILHGTRYWKERFGERGAQRFLFLPDTFGFPACLPQIMAGCGLDTFLTDKMAWCERNEFPHVTFRWRGIDGTEVLTHLTPGQNYNAPLQPADLCAAEARVVRKDQSLVGEERVAVSRWVQPFGYGDGGGGPTAETAHRAARCAEVEGLPRVEQGRVDDFCAAIHAERAEQRAATGRDLFVWDGELYMEGHRGTLTTQGWLKRANAAAERRLRTIEIMLASLPDAAVARGFRDRLDAAWKAVLLHQFHDVLPGSSIAEVYDDARAAYAEIEAELDELLTLAGRALTAGADVAGLTEPVLVFNPSSHRRSAVAKHGLRRLFINDVPALGGTIVEGALEGADMEGGVRTTDRSLQNEFIAVAFDLEGRVIDLRERGGRAAVNAVDDNGAPIPLDRLVAYEDRPRRWEAWNVDDDHTDVAERIDGTPESVQVVEARTVRGSIEVCHRFRDSLLRRRYSLASGARHLEVEVHVDWHEERTLLRSLHAVNVRARHATYGIQFGHLVRATHRNTSWDQARFEVPGHRWMDLSQPGTGLAVLDDGKFGRSCHGNVLGLSLLRCPNFPDPGADRGEHVIRYGLMPHGGDWRAAGVPREAAEAAEGTVVVVLEAVGPEVRGRGEPLARPFDLVVEEGDFEVACFKPAEDGDDRILRLVERHGGTTRGRIEWRRPVGEVHTVDLLERPRAGGAAAATTTGGVTRFSLAPFEILTLRIAP